MTKLEENGPLDANLVAIPRTEHKCYRCTSLYEYHVVFTKTKEIKVCERCCKIVHLIGIILIVRNGVIELVNKLLIISIILLHLKLSHWICLILHLLIHILNHSLVPHHQVLHYHWIALLWCVLMNWKRRSVSHLAHFICLLRNRRKKFCLWHSDVSFIEVLGT